LREFHSNHGGIRWLRRYLKKRISQQNSGFEKLVLVGRLSEKPLLITPYLSKF
jgi:hypothetical protein